MLAYDNVRLDRRTKNVNTEHYDKCTKLLKDLGPVVEIELTGSSNRRGIRRLSPDFSPKVNISRTARYINGDLDMSVTVFDNERTLVNGQKSFHPTHIPIRGTRVFATDGKDLDVLYFLVFISPSCEYVKYEDEKLAEDIKALQNTNKAEGRSRLRLKVSLFEARNELRQAMNITKLAEILTGPKPGMNGRQVMDKLYSLKMATSPVEEINRAKLYTHLMTSRNGQPDHAAIEAIITRKGGAHDELIGLMYRGLDTGMLKLESPKPGIDGQYFYKDQDGKHTIPFVTVKYAMGDPVMQAVGVLEHDRDMADLLRKLVGDKKK